MSIQNARTTLPVLFGGGAAATYTSKVLGYSPIAYWPLNETSGTTADNAEGTAALDATYTAVTLDNADGPIAGERAGLWDGSTSYTSVPVAAFDGVFNPAELTIAAWVKVASGAWTDGNIRRVFIFGEAGTNYVSLFKNSVNNQIGYLYRAGGTSKQYIYTTAAPTGWVHIAITASAGSDEVKAYFNGSQVGSTLTGLGTYSGGINAFSFIGAESSTPTVVWNGNLAHLAVFSSALGDAAIAELATA